MKDNQPLYKKNKTVEIYLTPENKLQTEVRHIDPRHNLKLSVLFATPTLIIEDIECEMEQIPHQECIKAKSALKSLIGQRVQPGIIKLAQRKLNGIGCAHLNNLFHEAVYSVFQGMGLYVRQVMKKLYPDISIEQMYKLVLKIRPELIDSCVCYTPQSDLMQTFENTPFPNMEEALKLLLRELKIDIGLP